MSEYALVLGLLLGVLLLSVGLFGTNLQGIYGNLSASLGGASQENTAFNSPPALLSQPALQQDAVAEKTAAITNPAYLTKVSTRLPRGGEALLKHYPVDVAQSIDTVGVDGTSRLFAQALEELYQAMKADKSMTAEEDAALSKIVKDGYALADQHAKVKALMAQAEARPDPATLQALREANRPFGSDCFGNSIFNVQAAALASPDTFTQTLHPSCPSGNMSSLFWNTLTFLRKSPDSPAAPLVEHSVNNVIAMAQDSWVWNYDHNRGDSPAPQSNQLFERKAKEAAHKRQTDHKIRPICDRTQTTRKAKITCQ